MLIGAFFCIRGSLDLFEERNRLNQALQDSQEALDSTARSHQVELEGPESNSGIEEAWKRRGRS